MFCSMALTTATGPGTIVGGKSVDRISQRRASATIESILGIVLIANEVVWNHLQHAVADDFVNKIQVVFLHGDLVIVPCANDVWQHFLPEQPCFLRILDVD